MVWNIGKHEYIDTWILHIYKKNRWDKNYSKFMEMFGKSLKMIK